MPIDIDIAVRELTDRAAITEVLHAYARLVDELDFADAAGVFTDDCMAEYGVRETDTLHSSATVADWLASQLRDGTATSHHISNVQISFPDADHAEATSYLYAWHRPPGAAVDPVILARYVDSLERTRPAGASPTAECSPTAWSDFRTAFCARFPARPRYRRPPKEDLACEVKTRRCSQVTIYGWSMKKDPRCMPAPWRRDESNRHIYARLQPERLASLWLECVLTTFGHGRTLAPIFASGSRPLGEPATL